MFGYIHRHNALLLDILGKYHNKNMVKHKFDIEMLLCIYHHGNRESLIVVLSLCAILRKYTCPNYILVISG